MSNCSNRGENTKLFVALDGEGRRLLAIFEASRAREVAAAKRISSPLKSELYPARLKMENDLADLQSRSAAAWSALRTHYNAMRDGKKSISRVA
jgi:hypothetical protein